MDIHWANVRYFRPAGRSLEVVQEFLTARQQVHERRMELLEHMKARSMFLSDTTPLGFCYGDLESDLPPEEHRRSMRMKVMETVLLPTSLDDDGPRTSPVHVWKPNARTVDGRRLRDQLRKLSEPSFFRFSSQMGVSIFLDDGFCFKPGVHVMNEDVFLYAHASDVRRYPDAIPVKHSEYWRVREAFEEMLVAEASARPHD